MRTSGERASARSRRRRGARSPARRRPRRATRGRPARAGRRRRRSQPGAAARAGRRWRRPRTRAEDEPGGLSQRLPARWGAPPRWVSPSWWSCRVYAGCWESDWSGCGGLGGGSGGGRWVGPDDADLVAAPAEEDAPVEIGVEPAREGRGGEPDGGIDADTDLADGGERGRGARDRQHLDRFGHAAARSENFA